MQYQVPQFIEIEDKIFGPLTFKQALYAGGGGAIGFILWVILPNFIAIVVGVPIVAFFMASAFYQVNGRPFLVFVEGAIKYFFSAKRYIWRKVDKKIEPKKVEKNTNSQIALPRLSQSKLKDLSWGLDVHEKIGEKGR